MKSKPYFFYDKAGHAVPAFYHAFTCIDGPILHMFIQAHLDLLRRLLAYVKRSR